MGPLDGFEHARAHHPRATRNCAPEERRIAVAFVHQPRGQADARVWVMATIGRLMRHAVLRRARPPHRARG